MCCFNSINPANVIIWQPQHNTNLYFADAVKCLTMCLLRILPVSFYHEVDVTTFNRSVQDLDVIRMRKINIYRNPVTNKE